MHFYEDKSSHCNIQIYTVGIYRSNMHKIILLWSNKTYCTSSKLIRFKAILLILLLMLSEITLQPIEYTAIHFPPIYPVQSGRARKYPRYKMAGAQHGWGAIPSHGTHMHITTHYGQMPVYPPMGLWIQKETKKFSTRRICKTPQTPSLAMKV